VESAPVDHAPSDPREESLLLVSDTSTEAERLIASLRVRGFKVRDVPLVLLASRIEAQRPKLVICDGRATQVLSVLERVRGGNWGKTVEILLLGGDASLLQAGRSVLSDIAERVYARPIDVYSVLQRIEEILGLPGGLSGRARSLAALPRVVGPTSAPAQANRLPTPIPRGRRTPLPRGSVPPRAPASLVPKHRADDAEGRPVVATAAMSPELEGLLSEAERRLDGRTGSPHPPSGSQHRLSPEEELDVILPPDVLAALDESIELEDEDETSTPGPRGSEHAELRPTGNTSPRAMVTEGTGARAMSEGETGIGRFAPRGLPPLPRDAERKPGLERGFARVPSSPPTGTDAAVDRPHLGLTHHLDERTGMPVFERGGTHAGTNPDSRLEEPVPETAAAPSVPPGREDDERDSSSTTPPRVARAPSLAPRLRLPSPPSSRGAGAQARSKASASLGPSLLPRERQPGVHGMVSLAPDSQPHGPEIESHKAESVRDRITELRKEGPSSARHLPPLPLPEPSSALSHELPSEPRRGALSETYHELPSEPRRGAPSEAYQEPPPELRRGLPSEPRREVPRERRGAPDLDVPAVLGPLDVLRSLARCVRSRFTGALALEDENGIRRVVFRDGDFVMVASAIDSESLVSYLIQRGDLQAEMARRARTLPQFGRHAGAALIAHGYLRQDELWPVLRGHAEWLLGHALGISQGSAGLETELPARLLSEPAVFGGAAGAEILLEVLRRQIPPEAARSALGGPRVRLARGPESRLLSECALSPSESQLVERLSGQMLAELITELPTPDFVAALLGLVELGVLETLAPSQNEPAPSSLPVPRDPLDDGAIRASVLRRRALVDEGDYFAILGVGSEATTYEIRHAYLELRQKYDPRSLLTAATADLRDDLELYIEVLDEAFEILNDPTRRARYKRALGAGAT
jgi:hypothetical protein